MQVSQWLGHATYSLTLDVYGDYIPETDGGAPNALPEPVVPIAPGNVVKLFERQAN
jgi:integrase